MKNDWVYDYDLYHFDYTYLEICDRQSNQSSKVLDCISPIRSPTLHHYDHLFSFRFKNVDIDET
ncbi:hypothetical protein QR98_0037220 [Sarcoptes scabiei]|uniref:Uncharacterized protein n=1 Tax=Sarcoptes scabiei TaxID=52283 RepID=A0A132A2U2_SARSC|nr:hypothetical protein QR98_0037220 [Sarcoptes scabiei]